jgi:glutathione synthase/RimK-type ligase-like ATP-grasp enzyme
VIPQIAFVTAAQMPKPDIETRLLVEELAGLGISAIVVAWTDPIEWSTIPLVVLRSPWDYVDRFTEFLDWAKQVDAATRLINRYEVVRWNAHKSYLLDLQRNGVPVVPMKLLPAKSKINSLGELVDADEIVVKPAVGIGAMGAMRGKADDPAVASHVCTLLDAGDVLVQPFVPSIATTGEASLIYFAGAFSHAIRKQPAAGDYRVQDHHGGTVHEYEPTSRERHVAAAALAAIPGTTLYARFDLVEWRGEPVLMELELIEPELFLRFSRQSVTEFARHLREALGED